jgi:GNAT superfamily N-acetyltransferase
MTPSSVSQTTGCRAVPAPAGDEISPDSRYNRAPIRKAVDSVEVRPLVAHADIIIADDKLLAQAVELYNSMFRPKREPDFFKRRFTGRYNPLTLLARLGDRPVGFWIGFELKPGMFYHWLGGVSADARRQGIGRQLQEAQQAWARDHGYEYIRCECLNHQREFIHFVLELGYDIVGIRWDSTHADNLMVFEKNLLD